MHLVKLSDVPIGKLVKVRFLKNNGLNRRRMMDLGIIPEATVLVSRRSPLGDPKAYIVRGAEIALRKEEASQIIVERL